MLLEPRWRLFEWNNVRLKRTVKLGSGSIKCTLIYPFFRPPKINVNSSDFSCSYCFRIVFYFKSGHKIVSLSLKSCRLHYRGNNIGTKVTPSFVNKVKYIKIGRNNDEKFSSPAFLCTANPKTRTIIITVVDAKGILLFIPKNSCLVRTKIK